MTATGSPLEDVAPASASSRMLLPHARRQQLHQRRAENVSDQVLDAAALQDQLMRRMKLDLGGKQPRAVVVLNGRIGGLVGGCQMQRRRTSDKTSTDRRAHPAHSSGNNGRFTAPAVATNRTAGNPTADTTHGGGFTSWTCQACSAENFVGRGRSDINRCHGRTSSIREHRGSSARPHAEDEAGRYCSVCLQPGQLRRNLGNSDKVVGMVYGDDRPGSQEQKQQRRTTVTFAQIRGLEEPPEPSLTQGEWRCDGVCISLIGGALIGGFPPPILETARTPRGDICKTSYRKARATHRRVSMRKARDSVGVGDGVGKRDMAKDVCPICRTEHRFLQGDEEKYQQV